MLAPVFGVSALHCVCTRYVPVYVPPPMLHMLCTTSYVVYIMYHVSTVELYGWSEADSFLVGIERERTRILVDQWTAVYVTPARAPRLKCLDLIQSSLFPEGERENQHALNTTLLLLSSSPAVVFGLLSDSALVHRDEERSFNLAPVLNLLDHCPRLYYLHWGQVFLTDTKMSSFRFRGILLLSNTLCQLILIEL